MDKHQLGFFLVLAFTAGTLYILPFIPALLEWRIKSDSDPFEVNFQDRTMVDYVIRIFKTFIDDYFSSILEEYKETQSFFEGQHACGFDYYISGKVGAIAPLYLKKNQVILFCNEGALPDNLDNDNKIYARKSLETGSNNHLNQVIAEGDIHLKTGAMVRQLLLSGGAMTINADCILQGYTKAKEVIYLDHSIQFQYLHAPQIDFGRVLIEAPASTVVSQKILRQIWHETLVIAKGEKKIGHMIVKADLLIQNNCVITGNIKCHGRVVVESNTVIFGSIISEKDIHIASHCFIEGPVVARGTIKIEKNCRIGRVKALTSIIAENIVIDRGCRVSGLVLAKRNGVFK